MVNFTNLGNAILSLKNAFRIYDENCLREDAPEKILLRDGVIQRFEFTFELCWKTLKRHIEQSGTENVDTLYLRDIFRVGFEKGLIDDPVRWFDYQKNRNQTTHIYDDAIAHEVFCAARNLISDALILLQRMKEKAQ